jgi:hypothetical protein
MISFGLWLDAGVIPALSDTDVILDTFKWHLKATIIRKTITRLSPFSFKLFAIPFDYDTNVGGNPGL